MILPLSLKLHQVGYEKRVTSLRPRNPGNMSGFAVKQTFA